MGPWEARTRRAERLAAAWRSGMAPLELERLIELLGDQVVFVGSSADGGVGAGFEIDGDFEDSAGEAPVGAVDSGNGSELQADAVGEAVATFERHLGWDAHW
jgi:hypothetical protein